MTETLLRSEDFSFFQAVTHAAFANPFSDKREQLDRALSGLLFQSSSWNIRQNAILKVEEKIKALEQKNKASLEHFFGEEQNIMKYAFLFEIFHKFINDLDILIEKQIISKDESCPVPFANDALALLCKRGFSEKNALRYFALFFQLRRTFYFIENSIIGISPSIKQLRCTLWNNIFSNDINFYNLFLWNRMEDFSTLLLGETGTGKGSAAAAIGRSVFIPFDLKKQCFSESFAQSFIAINLSQFSESLIESELFGHKKGAFTGAIETHQGIFNRCSPHGAIFLDEIGEVSIPVQIKLLEIIQQRVFSPVGSYEKLRFSGRVIAATNQDLRMLRNEKQFRDDFYYRLCSDVIEVPPLRQRIAENPKELNILVDHCASKIIGFKNPELNNTLYNIILKHPGKNYPWPGNVRELEQCIRRIFLKGSYEGDLPVSSQDDLSLYLNKIEAGQLNAKGLLSGYCSLLYKQHGTLEEVSRKTGLDRRTVKKYLCPE